MTTKNEPSPNKNFIICSDCGNKTNKPTFIKIWAFTASLSETKDFDKNEWNDIVDYSRTTMLEQLNKDIKSKENTGEQILCRNCNKKFIKGERYKMVVDFRSPIDEDEEKKFRKLKNEINKVDGINLPLDGFDFTLNNRKNWEWLLICKETDKGTTLRRETISEEYLDIDTQKIVSDIVEFGVFTCESCGWSTGSNLIDKAILASNKNGHFILKKRKK